MIPVINMKTRKSSEKSKHIDVWQRFPFFLDFPCGSDGKVSAYNVGNLGSIPGSGRSPGEGNATHFRILAWKIPWTEEPDRLQSMGSQKVRHN